MESWERGSQQDQQCNAWTAMKHNQGSLGSRFVQGGLEWREEGGERRAGAWRSTLAFFKHRELRGFVVLLGRQHPLSSSRSGQPVSGFRAPALSVKRLARKSAEPISVSHRLLSKVKGFDYSPAQFGFPAVQLVDCSQRSEVAVSQHSLTLASTSPHHPPVYFTKPCS
jgi:hypothetical protein